MLCYKEEFQGELRLLRLKLSRSKLFLTCTFFKLVSFPPKYLFGLNHLRKVLTLRALGIKCFSRKNNG